MPLKPNGNLARAPHLSSGFARAPAPDLQTLVAQHSGYDRVTPEVWTRFDAALSHWRARQRAGADYEVVGLTREEIRALRRGA